MSSIIRIKRSDVSGNPTTLAAGELAYSSLTDDGSNGGERLYIGSGPETAGNAANHDVIGGRYFTKLLDAATHSNNGQTLIKRDAQGNFSAGTITATSFVGNATSATKWASERSITFSGDLSGVVSFDGTSNKTVSLSLANVNSNTGSFGSASSIPVLTVDSKGRVTAISSQEVDIPDDAVLSFSGDTGNDSLTLISDTLKFEGGTGVSTSVSSGKVAISVGQNVAPTSDVTFRDITTNGTLYSNNITADAITVDGHATISGNLTVQGTTTTLNTEELAVADINITVAKDATNAAAANGAGLTVAGPTVPATLKYSSPDDRWNLNKPLTVSMVYGNVTGTVTGNASSASTATRLTTGRTIAMTGDVTYTSGAFTGAGNVTGVATLSNVNTNTGSFGSGTSVPSFTVNAKGLVTAASSTAIPTATYTTNGLARFSNTNFSVASGNVTVTAIDGGTY